MGGLNAAVVLFAVGTLGSAFEGTRTKRTFSFVRTVESAEGAVRAEGTGWWELEGKTPRAEIVVVSPHPQVFRLEGRRLTLSSPGRPRAWSWDDMDVLDVPVLGPVLAGWAPLHVMLRDGFAPTVDPSVWRRVAAPGRSSKMTYRLHGARRAARLALWSSAGVMSRECRYEWPPDHSGVAIVCVQAANGLGERLEVVFTP